MTRLVLAEVRKLRTVWSTYALLGATAAATAAIALLVALAPRGRGTEAALLPAQGTPGWFDLVFSAMGLGQDFALVLGILIVSGEYRHRTAASTFLTEPRRERVTAAKLAVAFGGGAAAGVLSGAAALAVGAALVAAGKGTATDMLVEFRSVFPGMLAAAVLFAVYGSGLGALLRNQVVALVVGLGLSTVVEPIVVAVWSAAGRWLPNQAAQSLHSVTASARSGVTGAAADILPAWQGALVLLAYGVVLAAAGSFTTMRADIT